MEESMKAPRPGNMFLAALVMFALAACGGGNNTPVTAPVATPVPAPLPKQMSLVYQEPAPPPLTGPVEASCTHSFVKVNMRVKTDAGELVPLNGEAPTRSLTLPTPGPGEHWLYVYDINYCGVRPNCPTPTTGISLNGKTLTRQVAVDGWCTALAFTVSADGEISP